jgi:peptidyl-prolyl cis-trans isomerase SurA
MTPKKILPLVICLCLSFFSRAQKSDETLFTIGGTPVSVGEFKYIYEKNNANDKGLYSEKSVREYLNLYINFKLKVREAHDEGLDTLPKFLAEFNKYRAQLAQPYLTDRQVTDKLLDEAYERMKWELRASHILIPVAPDASPKDTMEAYKLALHIRDTIMKGADFEKVARKYSKDPSVANNGGDLGYFTVFQMIYPFESAAYQLDDSGKISLPVRTQFGYHIIKITSKRPYRGEIQVRHILINSLSTDPADKQAIAKSKIDSIYNLLKKGASFSDLAKQYSDHVQSKNSGGELPKFNSFTQPFPEAFKDQAFSLKHNGDFTAPFRSEIGWHIIQREDLKGLQSRKELEEMLKQKVSRDSRSEKSRDAALARFKKDMKFKEKGNAVSKFVSLTDTSLLHGHWKMSPKVSAKTVMFSFDNKEYNQKDFAEYLLKVQAADRFSDLKYALRQYLTAYENQEVYSYVDKNLERTHPDFKNVSNEYKEGILLFDITDKKVWSKAMSDTTGLRKYFEENRDKYLFKERAQAAIFDLRDANTVPGFIKELTSKPSDALANEYIKKDPLSLNYKESTFERGENKILDTVKWDVGIQNAGYINGRYYIVKINKIIPPERKQLTDVKGTVIADYQDYLEKQWLTSLKQKYPVVVNEPVVASMIKK